MKIGKYLKFHFKCMRTGKMPNNGLCSCFDSKKLENFAPTSYDHMILMNEGLARAYWGYGESFINSDPYDRRVLYTPLRQTIVLFLAAMNNEL